MTATPASLYPSNAARTNAEMKQVLEDICNVLREQVGGNTLSTLTLAADSITPTTGYHLVDTQAAAATDDLRNILTTNMPAGRVIALSTVSGARDVVVKHLSGGSGQIQLATGTDLTLDDPSTVLFLRLSGTTWVEVDRAYGADIRGLRTYYSGARQDVASAASVSLLTSSEYVRITGSTGITAISVPDGQMRTVLFATALTITHNATTLILPGGVNLTTAPGDMAILVGEAPGTRMIDYTLAASTPIVAGSSIGISRTETTAGTTGTAVIPLDDTIPQNIEGTEFSALTTSYTPKFANSLLKVEVYIPFGNLSANNTGILALFRDAAADAIQVGVLANSGNATGITLSALVAAGSVSATTLRLRFGPNGGTMYLNSLGGTSFFSTAKKAWMLITEIKQ